MRKFENLTGQKFGRLTVVKLSDKRYQDGSKLWECKCDCGNTVYRIARTLKNGESKSCGCLKNELSSKANLHDLTGIRFGKLTVIRRDLDLIKKNGGKEPRWLCKCDCGNETVVLSSNLKSGSVKSCGCIRNQIDDLSGKTFGHLKVICLSRNDGRRTFYECKCDCGKIIIVNRDSLTSGATISCGHIQKIRSKENTEIVKQYFVNDTNVYAAKGKKILKNNTSGITGVYKYKSRWRAEITFQKKRYFLGIYDKIEDATKARKIAENKLHGDFLKWFAEEFPERWEKMNKNKLTDK